MCFVFLLEFGVWFYDSVKIITALCNLRLSGSPSPFPVVVGLSPSAKGLDGRSILLQLGNTAMFKQGKSTKSALISQNCDTTCFNSVFKHKTELLKVKYVLSILALSNQIIRWVVIKGLSGMLPVTFIWWSYQRQPPPKWAVLVHMT